MLTLSRFKCTEDRTLDVLLLILFNECRKQLHIGLYILIEDIQKQELISYHEKKQLDTLVLIREEQGTRKKDGYCWKPRRKLPRLIWILKQYYAV